MSNKLFGFLKGLSNVAPEDEPGENVNVGKEKPVVDDEPKLTDEMADFCIKSLQTILEMAEFEGNVVLKSKEGSRLFLEIADAGDDVGRLIGREGHTLDCLKTLVRSMFFQQYDTPLRLALDTGGYLNKKQKNFRQKAINAANRVKQYGKSVALEPMNAADRRGIHVMFQGSEDIRTASEGEGKDRHVVLHAR